MALRSSLPVFLILTLSGIAAAEPITAPAQPPVIFVRHSIEGIYQNNLFDPERKQWKEITTAVTAAPAAAPAAKITDQDVQIYGVMVMGSEKKAIVKLGGQFANLNQPGGAPAGGPKSRGMQNPNMRAPSPVQQRQFTILTEGERVGDYTLTGISQEGLTFSSSDGSQNEMVAFNKKSDRQVTANPPVTAMGAGGFPMPGALPMPMQGQPPANVFGSGGMMPPNLGAMGQPPGGADQTGMPMVQVQPGNPDDDNIDPGAEARPSGAQTFLQQLKEREAASRLQ